MDKRCNTCQRARPLTDFSRRRASPDGLQPRCRECWRADYLAHQEQRKAVAAAAADLALRRRRDVVVGYLATHPCVDCGEDDIRCLDFDHRDPRQKTANVSTLIATHVVWSRIEAEIALCDVRCASCHRKRTATYNGDWRHRHWLRSQELAVAAATARLRVLFGRPVRG